MRPLTYILICISFLSFSACTNNTKPDNNNLTPGTNNLSLINIFQLNIPEPSGLTFDNNKKNLIIVSDNSGKFYKTNLQGVISEENKIIDGDMEGVTIINDSVFAAVLERKREIITFNKSGKILDDIKTGLTGIPNNGFEGIIFLPSENIFLIANQKNPTSLYKITLDGKVLLEQKISFATELSGLYYDEIRNAIWILSAGSNTVFRSDLNFQVISKYNIPDVKLEGIAVDNNDMYLVSDKNSTLYHYKILN